MCSVRCSLINYVVALSPADKLKLIMVASALKPIASSTLLRQIQRQQSHTVCMHFMLTVLVFLRWPWTALNLLVDSIINDVCLKYKLLNILTRDIDIANLSVCLSVCYVPVSDENSCFHLILEWLGKKLWRFPNHSGFTSIKHLHGIPTGSHPAGARNTGAV